MSQEAAASADGETQNTIRVRYWAGARAAVGTDHDDIAVDGTTTLAALVQLVLDRHRDKPRLMDVVGACSVLVGDRPVGTADPSTVVLRPGQTVELLPPFAGG